MTIKQRLLEQADNFKAQKLSIKEIAKVLDCSVFYVRLLNRTHKLGLCRWVEKRKSVTDICDTIIHHIMENGGTAKGVARELGINILSCQVHDRARALDIDLKQYRYIGLKAGLWIIEKPGWKRYSTADYLVPATCQGCGVEKELSLINLRTGKTGGCISCKSANRETYIVRCQETSQYFRSIRSWVKQLGQLKSYSALRAKIHKEPVSIDGRTYELFEAA